MSDTTSRYVQRGGGVALKRYALLALLAAALMVGWAVLSEQASAEPGGAGGHWETSTWTKTVKHPAVHGGIQARQISTGWDHNYALGLKGALTGWGDNTHGQTTTPQTKVWEGNVNGRVSNRSLVEMRATRYVQVDAGGQHTCALTTEGEIECWGDNDSGQTNVPIRMLAATDAVKLPAPGYTDVSAGGYHSCALKSDGEIVCWGANGDGQAKAPDGTFTDVDAGSFHTCALEAKGSVKCWGRNDFGQTNEPYSDDFVSISAGGDHSCAINNVGGALCWGRNNFAQEYPPAGEYTQIASGSWHACALWTTDVAPMRGKPDVLGHQSPPGNVDCWGDNGSGKATPPPKIAFAQISAGGTSTCGIQAGTQRIFCWGYGAAASAPTELVSAARVERVNVEERTWVEDYFKDDLPSTGSVFAQTEEDGSMRVVFKPTGVPVIMPVFRHVPLDGSLTVNHWYYSEKLSFKFTQKSVYGDLAPREHKIPVGRIALRLLPTGHIELALVTNDGKTTTIPQNHNRIPNPAEPGKWWRTDRVSFGG